MRAIVSLLISLNWKENRIKPSILANLPQGSLWLSIRNTDLFANAPRLYFYLWFCVVWCVSMIFEARKIIRTSVPNDFVTFTGDCNVWYKEKIHAVSASISTFAVCQETNWLTVSKLIQFVCAFLFAFSLLSLLTCVFFTLIFLMSVVRPNTSMCSMWQTHKHETIHSIQYQCLCWTILIFTLSLPISLSLTLCVCEQAHA